MIKKIRKVAVLGSGVMGSGIAAHLANAGIPSLMLDIVPFNPGPEDNVEDPAFRNRYAASNLAALKKAKPAALYSKGDLSLIEIGNFTDDMHKLADCDWIVEVVKEDLKIKQSLFAQVEEHRTPGTIISSNTSGLSIEGMTEGRSDDFRKHFLVTHFFNPVRYMKLLELIPGEETDQDVMDFMSKFGEEVLGKGIVYGKDTTNFIANRIGVYGMMKVLDVMQSITYTDADGNEQKYTVTDVDKIFGPALGRPKSAVFRTADLVGLDTFMHVAANCYDTLEDDEERDVFKAPGFLTQMVENKWLGGKTGQGFYKKTKIDGKKAILALDLSDLEYKPQGKVNIPSLRKAKKIDDVGARIKAVVESDDPAGKFATAAILPTLAYSARRMGEIADDIVNIDRGMRWGFNWEQGPFETWDALGVRAAVEQMKAADINVADWVTAMLDKGIESFYSTDEGGEPVFYDVASGGYKPVPRSDKDISLGYLKQTSKTNKVLGTAGASLFDIGDGVACLQFHSALNAKLNPIDDAIIEAMEQSLDKVESDFDAMVVYHDGDNFSAGANLVLLGMHSAQGNWEAIRQMVSRFQAANQRLRYSSKPVVAAPSGLALGGGAEVVLGANAVQAAAELYIGLVEVGVGLIPGGAGNLNLLRNLYGQFSNDKAFDPFPFIQKAFMTIGMAHVATSAFEGREAGFLRATDGVTLNRSHLLNAAKQRALGMARAGFTPPRPLEFRLPGPDAAATVDMLLYSMVQNNQISDHDRLIGSKLATVLTGGQTSLGNTVSEDRLLELELEVFLSLCGEKKSQERMQYMVMNNKPLRN